MDSLIKQEWVNALRSGKYKQGQEILKEFSPSNNCDLYCCLGVLREINPNVEGNEDHTNPNTSTELSVPSLEFIGMDKDEQSALVSMNDGDEDRGNESFNQIADYIEENM